MSTTKSEPISLLAGCRINQRIRIPFLSETPLAIVIAPNTQRLLEAELMWLNAKRLHDPLKVLAVVDDPKKVGIQQVMRANYFTDKTVAYNNMGASFRSFVRDSLGVAAH